MNNEHQKSFIEIEEILNNNSNNNFNSLLNIVYNIFINNEDFKIDFYEKGIEPFKNSKSEIFKMDIMLVNDNEKSYFLRSYILINDVINNFENLEFIKKCFKIDIDCFEKNNNLKIEYSFSN